MKSLYQSRNGFRYDRFQRTGVNPMIQDSVVPNRSTVYSVTAGAMVKGDFTDPNPWSYVVQDVKYLRGVNSYSQDYGQGNITSYQQEGCIASYDAHKMFNVTAVPADVVNEALSRLNSMARGDVDLSIDLAQAGQTKKMLSAANAAELFTRNFKGLTQLIAGVSAIRLTYIYGIKPTLQTIYSSADQSINIVINEIENFTATASCSIPSSIEKVEVQYNGAVPVTMNRNGKAVCKYGVRLKTQANDPAYWTSLNPASIAWELMPYSFVVDWFIDIGSYLRNLETSLLFANRFVSGYRSEGVFYDVSGQVENIRLEKSFKNTTTYMTKATCSARYRALTRSKLYAYPAPRLPTFKANLGSQRLLNAAALLGVLLRK